MSADWSGNKTSAFTTNGASNHSLEEREANDFYATDPVAVEMLLNLEKFSTLIWEPACGQGHISRVLENHNHRVISSDIIDRGYSGTLIVDFLNIEESGRPIHFGDIITNPPYKYAKEFVEKALEVIAEGHKVAMFLKLTFLESKSRRELFEKHPPKVIYVSSSRLQCAKNGDFKKYKKGVGTAIAYAWFVWEKGFMGDPIVRWFN